MFFEFPTRSGGYITPKQNQQKHQTAIRHKFIDLPNENWGEIQLDLLKSMVNLLVEIALTPICAFGSLGHDKSCSPLLVETAPPVG